MIELNETIITKETAKLANEKGFDIYCNHFYNRGSNYNLQSDPIIRTGDDIILEAPTKSHLQHWLREKYNIYVNVATNSLTCHFPMNQLVDIDGTTLKGPKSIKNYKTYEEALEVGLFEALNLI